MIRDRDPVDFVPDMMHFCIIAFEKLTACRNIEKQIFHLNIGTVWSGTDFLRNEFRSFDNNVKSCIRFCIAGFHFNPGYRSNRSERFAAKAEGMDCKKIFSSADF